ncbi:RmlC-like cupin [Polyplosphaeria fusca]|uniref:RmlC-like cupin n=1 Tax=Polyplosphaeria fusca TaxID=682080 RepID=A0A9P4RA28_9PLEO|nr:RmlC-like cupin [Polyplosphaeria fusca]
MLLASLLTLLLPSLTTAADQTLNPDLNAKLMLAATNVDRQALLPKNEDWIFDFTQQKVYTFAPGSVVNANAATFPTLAGVGMTMAQLNLGPCAMLPPHWHPRATNLVVAVTGNITTWMVGENGVKVVTTELTPGKMTVFPRASLHAMQNNGCDNAQLISALNSDDAGTTNIFNTAFDNIPHEVLAAAFGDDEFDAGTVGKNIPKVGTGSVMGSAECRRRCGI